LVGEQGDGFMVTTECSTSWFFVFFHTFTDYCCFCSVVFSEQEDSFKVLKHCIMEMCRERTIQTQVCQSQSKLATAQIYRLLCKINFFLPQRCIPSSQQPGCLPVQFCSFISYHFSIRL
jgi:hypothetical protein